MKKLNYLFALLFLFAAFVSCDKRNIEARLEAMPEYTGTAIPIVNVGNTSCEDLDGEYLFSSGRVNFVNGTFDFSDVNNTEDWPEGVDPVTGWPKGLSVTVSEDGRYVSFNYESDSYCVGAVIVKGGNASNVYTYDPATKSDANLSSPVNASGFPAALSNLTFCFVECQEPAELVIALKSFYWPGPKSWMNSTWATSSGEMAFTPVLPYDWCGQLGINYYPSTSAFTLLGKATLTNVGTVNITEEYPGGVHSLIVTITLLDGFTMDKSYLFVGSKEELEATVLASGCPEYTSWMFQDEPDDSNVQVIIIPL